MTFWKIAYSHKWVTLDQLRLVVKTAARPHGEITPEEFTAITGQVYESAG